MQQNSEIIAYLKENIKGNGVDHVLDNDTENGVGASLSLRLASKGLSGLESSLSSSTLHQSSGHV